MKKTKKVHTKTKNSTTVSCNLEDLFKIALIYVPKKYGDMYILKYSNNEQTLLKNFRETAENLLILITLTSKTRNKYEKELFEGVTNLDIVENWQKLYATNPWYDLADTILFMWTIDRQLELECTLGDLRNKLFIGLKKLLFYKLQENPDEVFKLAPKDIFKDINCDPIVLIKSLEENYKSNINWILKLYIQNEIFTQHEYLDILVKRSEIKLSQDNINNILLTLFFFNRIPSKNEDPDVKFIIGYLLKSTFQITTPWLDTNPKLERFINTMAVKLDTI